MAGFQKKNSEIVIFKINSFLWITTVEKKISIHDVLLPINAYKQYRNINGLSQAAPRCLLK